MAISHLCMSCGYDLARIPVRPDPHYALPVVICPDCGTAAVRRRHPMLHAWRTLLRIQTSVIAIVFQLGLLAAFTSAVVTVCLLAGEHLVQGDLVLADPLSRFVAVLSLVAMPLALGAWLTAGLGHLRPLPRWLLVPALTFLPIALDCVGEPLARHALDACGLSISLPAFRWDRLAARVVVLGAIVTVATAGIPLGLLARAAEQHWRGSRWRARRRRLRARRTGR